MRLAKLRHYPRLTTSLAVAALALALFVRSWWPVTPLPAHAGFAAALAHLDSVYTAEAFVVVWPPEQARTLAALPSRMRAADAVPQRPGKVFVLLPTSASPPPELALPLSQLDFDKVRLLTYASGRR